MHVHRMMALVGAVVGIIGLFFSGLTTDGEAALPALSQASDAFPDGIPTIWGGLASWAQVVLAVLIVVVVVLAVRPDRSTPYDKMGAGLTTAIGVALFAYAIVKYLDAADSADTLEGGFAQAAAGGIPGVEAWSVAAGSGFFVLMAGTILVIAGGALSLAAKNN